MDDVGIRIASTCAPSRLRQYKKYGTCFTRKELLDILDQYKKAYPHSHLQKRKEDEKKTIPLLVEQVNQAIQACAPSITPEVCAASQPFAQPLRHALFRDALRPEKPVSWNKDRYEWLTNVNIQLVMEQYERAIPSFKFLGVVPIDFAAPSPFQTCISPTVCQVRMDELRAKKKSCFAVVFNLDRHDQPGSHWVCCFGHLKPDHPAFGISYFNSVGLAPPKQISKFMDEVQQQARQLYPKQHKRFVSVYNKLRKQYGTSECGMFCLLYIIRCLELSLEKTTLKGDFYPFIFKSMQKDDHANRARNLLYSPLPPTDSAA